jgi:hypothetical protein
MRAVKILVPWPLVVLLAATAVAPRGVAPEPILAPLAHSTALTLEGASVPGALILRVRASAAGTPLNVSDLAASIDGKEMPATLQADGAWRVALPGHPGASEARLDVAVTHDGIRELLTAKVALSAPTAPQSGGAGVHNQLVWWVLNIAIVLIAALAISRRTS